MVEWAYRRELLATERSADPTAPQNPIPMRMRESHLRLQYSGLGPVILSLAGLGLATSANAQVTKPARAVEPTFQPGQFEGVFFSNPADQLQGQRPTSGQATAAQPIAATNSSAPASSTRGSPATDSPGWNAMISPVSLEDLIKGSKLRLDKIITSPNAFKGGGFVEARTEFSLQALLFAIIESYAGDVRWKSSAQVARQRFARVAANTKVGSDQVFSEAKARLLDLGDLISGTPLEAGNDVSAVAEVNWSELIDRVPLMQLLEWAHEENLSKLVANERTFQEERDAVLRYAELIAVLGKVALADEMPDASDEEYRALAQTMVEQAGQVVLAIKTSNAEQARTAAAQIGQSCTNCHDNYR